MKMNPKKVKRLSRILRMGMNLFFWSTVMAGAIFTVFFIILYLAPANSLKFPKTGNAFISYAFSGMISLKLDPSRYETANLKPVFLALVFAVVVGASMLAIISKQVIGILRTVEKDHPFDEKNSKRLFVIGRVFIGGSIAYTATQYAVALAMIESFKIKNLDVHYTFSGTMLTTGFLILILAGVFRYGSFLQKEYDATL